MLSNDLVVLATFHVLHFCAYAFIHTHILMSLPITKHRKLINRYLRAGSCDYWRTLKETRMIIRSANEVYIMFSRSTLSNRFLLPGLRKVIYYRERCAACGVPIITAS